MCQTKEYQIQTVLVLVLQEEQMLVLLEVFCIIKKTNTLFKTITGTAGGLLCHKK
jgi:hypothetical protein